MELINQPTADLMRSAGSSFLFALLFPLFMIFVTGGILAVYREDRKFTAGDFFAASGAFFWRFVRLALFSLIPFGILAVVLVGCEQAVRLRGRPRRVCTDRLLHSAGGAIVVILLLLFVRLWFDIAQVRAVVQDERSMWRNLWKALGITWRRRGDACFAFISASAVLPG